MAEYELNDVRTAARERRVELDPHRARNEVLAAIGNLTDCYEFAIAVLLELDAGDWSRVVELEPPHGGRYDEYGIRISEALAERFGLEVRCWYLKIKLYQSLYDEQVVFFVSLHPLEFPLARTSGVLRPGGQP